MTSFTVRTAAVFFVVSAAFEGLSLTSGVPLLGVVRGGAVAVFYHLLYVGLLLAMGIGLWVARHWGLRATLIGTIFYSLDKANYLLDHKAREADLVQMVGGYGGLLDILDKSSIQQITNWSTLLFVVSWWGFLLYLYVHRGYFGDARK